MESEGSISEKELDSTIDKRRIDDLKKEGSENGHDMVQAIRQAEKVEIQSVSYGYKMRVYEEGIAPEVIYSECGGAGTTRPRK